MNLFSRVMIRVDIELVSYFDVSCLSDRVTCFDEDG